MKRLLTYIPAVALLLSLTAPSLIHTAAAGKPPSDTPVTTTIDGLGVNTLPTLRIQSDQLGAYRNSASLSSLIQGAGDWELDMINFNSSPQRKALIDLRDPVPGSGPNGGAPTAPFAYQVVRARFISKCSQNGINMRTMQTNTPYFCPLAVAFDDAGGVRYRLAGNPANFNETNWVQINCVATDASSKCIQWRIVPSATQLNGEMKNVTKLLKVATRPNQSDQDMGDFYLSFGISLTNP
jgi:hypothetical protein